MRITWRSKIVWLGLLLSVSVHADDSSVADKIKGWFSPKPKQASAGTSQSEEPKGKCVDLRYQGWEIIQRLDSGMYEVVTRAARRNCWQNPDDPAIVYNPVQCMDVPEGPRVVLMTNGDKFESTGVISNSLWIEDTDKNPETVELPQTNGFKRMYRVVRESAGCARYGAKVAEQEKEKRKQVEAQNRAIAAEQQKKEDAERKRARDQAKKDQEERDKAAELWK